MLNFILLLYFLASFSVMVLTVRVCFKVMEELRQIKLLTTQLFTILIEFFSYANSEVKEEIEKIMIENTQEMES